MNDILYRIALSQVPGVGTYSARQLITYCGGVTQVFHTPPGKLKKIPGIKQSIAEALKNSELLRQAEGIAKACEKHRIELAFLSDSNYPLRLKETEDAPILLYSLGNTSCDHQKTIAFVGTRKASAYGRQCLEQLLQELVPWNPVVISGLAYGIDIHVHKTCLELGLRTLAVLGSGLKRIYPSQHQAVADSMCDQGGLLSEYPPFTKPEMFHFPARNRIIAGMSEGVVVVEAGETGGALITAQLANGYHREVMAIPGPLQAPTSFGCNQLIKNHQAHLVTSGQDIAALLNWDVQNPAVSKFKLRDEALIAQLSDEERRIYHCLEQEAPLQIDDLAWKSQTPIAQIANVLLQLEMQGLVQLLPGKKIRLT